MAGWMEKISGNKPRSADQAKERLQLVLIHDRTDLSPESLEILKNELLEVIARHVSFEPEGVRIVMTREGREQRLVADIPLKNDTRHKIG